MPTEKIYEELAQAGDPEAVKQLLAQHGAEIVYAEEGTSEGPPMEDEGGEEETEGGEGPDAALIIGMGGDKGGSESYEDMKNASISKHMKDKGYEDDGDY